MSRSIFRRAGALPVVALAVLLAAGSTGWSAPTTVRAPYDASSTDERCGANPLLPVVGTCEAVASADEHRGDISAAVKLTAPVGGAAPGAPLLSTGEASGTVLGTLTLPEEVPELPLVFTFHIERAVASATGGVVGIGGAAVHLRASTNNVLADCNSSTQVTLINASSSLFQDDISIIEDRDVQVLVGSPNCFEGGPVPAGDYAVSGSLMTTADVTVNTGETSATVIGRLVSVAIA